MRVTIYSSYRRGRAVQTQIGIKDSIESGIAKTIFETEQIFEKSKNYRNASLHPFPILKQTLRGSSNAMQCEYPFQQSYPYLEIESFEEKKGVAMDLVRQRKILCDMR